MESVSIKKILENVNQDCLQGLMEMMEFWLPMKNEKECPMFFPRIMAMGCQFNNILRKQCTNF